MANIDILLMIVEIAQHDLMNTVCFPGSMSVGKVGQSTNPQKHRMVKCLTVVWNFGIILSWML